MQPRDLLLEAFRAGLASADPHVIVPPHLPQPPEGRTVVVGAGKAAASMAYAVESHWPADRPLDGIVVTRYAHGLATERVRVVEASHPVPDEQGEQAARTILEEATGLGPNDLLLCLISGGGSSLLNLPATGVSAHDMKAVTKELLRCGAAIQEINTVRKHLSAIQGGQLAAATQARVLALIISDVTGDDPTHIASGPCCADPTTYQDALDVIGRYGVAAPDSVRQRLTQGRDGLIPETPKPGDRALAHAENRVIGTSQQTLQATARFLEGEGVTTAVLGDAVEGEARDVARVYGALAQQIRHHDQPWPAPVALISGGETTVTVRGSGRGGRNAEFLLALAIKLNGLRDVHAVACDTDGIDGSEDNAGAVIAPDSLARAQTSGLNAQAMLDDNDGYSFFEQLGDLVITGPTRTNVNDLRIILVQ